MKTPCVLHLNQLGLFIDELEKSSKREACIAIFMAHKARGVKEALSLKMEDIDFKKSTIIGIEWDYYFYEKLAAYLEERNSFKNNDSPYLFITREGNQVCRTHITKLFARTSKRCNFEFNVVARMIQWSYVRYWMKILSKKEILDKVKIKCIPRLLEFTEY